MSLEGLLGILETNLSGRRTRNDRNILKSTSTLASANTVIELGASITFNFISFESSKSSEKMNEKKSFKIDPKKGFRKNNERTESYGKRREGEKE